MLQLASAGIRGSSDAFAALHLLPFAVYVTDALGALTFWNDGARAMWGVAPMLGESAFEQWQPLDAAGVDEPLQAGALASVLRTGHPMRGAEGSARRHDGSVVHFSSSPTPILDVAGQLVGAIDVLLDLTTQRTTEARLRESEEHYRCAVELNPQMPWTADGNGKVLHVNERWCRLTGQSSETAARDGWIAAANPDDVPTVLKSMARCGESGEPLDVQFRIVLPDGADRWMRARASAHTDAATGNVRWYGSTEDIHDAVVARRALEAADERYRYAGLATRDVFWDHDLCSDTILWSQGLFETFGHAPDGRASEGSFWLDNVHHADCHAVSASLQAAISTGAARWTSEYRFRRADGSYAPVMDCGTILRDGHGAAVRAIGAMRDFSDRKQTEADLRLSEERLRLALAAAGLGITDFDVRTGIEHWSEELRAILGVLPGSASVVQTYLALVHPDDLPDALAQHRRTRAGDYSHNFRATRRIVRPIDGEVRWISTEGHALKDQSGDVHRVVITVRDVTEEKVAQDRIRWAATHDAMTGLPNKAAFQEALEEALAPNNDSPVSLLLVDIDDFKHVNDTLGHQAGDALLVKVSQRLRNALPDRAMVARFGGDEFAVILAGTPTELAQDAARSILQALQRSCAIDEARTVDVRASVGVATFPNDGRDGSTLLQAADIALYAAKAAGRYTVRRYSSEMRAGLQLQVSTIRQARRALADRTLVPFYQPKVSLDSGRIVGAEALLRWRHPRHGLQSAGTLLAALDAPELGPQIGDAMLTAVLSDLRAWLDAGLAIGRVAINSSPVQVGAPGYAERLLEALEQFAVPSSHLEVEVTETTLMGARVGQAIEELDLLRTTGVTVALDDFGTGYSSLSRLARLPVDVIKIDRSFVAGLLHARADHAVVEAVLGLSSALDLTVVAEGVETDEQATRLRGLGCELAQGYLFSPAVSPASFDWSTRYHVAQAS